MTTNNVKVSMGKSQIKDHPMLNGLVDLIRDSGDLVIGHSEEYVLLTDSNTQLFYRFDKTENGYNLTVTTNNTELRN